MHMFRINLFILFLNLFIYFLTFVFAVIPQCVIIKFWINDVHIY